MTGHVLVARLDNDGDVLLSGPAVRAVAAGCRRLTYLCGPRGRAAADLLPGVDSVLVHRAPWIDSDPPPVDPVATRELVDVVAGAHVDQALILTSFHQSPLPLALLLRLAGVPTVAAICEDYPGSLLDVRHRVDEDLHEVQRALSLATTLGYRLPAGDDGRLAVRGPDSVPADVGALGRYVVVHPGASVPARTLPAGQWAATVDHLVGEGHRVVVTGAPGESELTARTAGPVRPSVVDLGGRTTLASLAGVLAGAGAVIVGNTGPAHLAAAVGTPIVSIFAPTVPAARWRPWKVPHVLLGEQGIACAGCRARTCPVPGHPCIAGTRPSEISDALLLLGRLPSSRPEAVPGAREVPV